MAGPSRIPVSTTAIDPTNGPGPIHSSISKPPIFKSPNMVCPMDGKLPTSVPPNIVEAREYPFESMTQARVIHRRENTLGMTVVTSAAGATQPTATTLLQQSQQIGSHFVAPNPPAPPPPYPTGSAVPTTSTNKGTILQQVAGTPSPGNIAISSPLLVNLLQKRVPSNNAQQQQQHNVHHQQHNKMIPHTSALLKGGQELLLISSNNSSSGGGTSTFKYC